MPQLHKDNHYVPQLYLKQWATKGKIQTYRLLVPHANVPLWKEHSLRGIAFHQHLYTYRIGQEETDEFESWLGREFEAPAEEAIRRAINDERMAPEHWTALIRFAVAQDVRTPSNLISFLARQREFLPDLMTKTLENAVRDLEAAVKAGIQLPVLQSGSSNGFPLKVITIQAENGEGAVRAESIVGRRLWLLNLRRLLTETIKKVPYQHWTMVRAPSGVSWPTTDNPVVKLSYTSASEYNYGGGWGASKCDILLPLSPTHLLHNFVGQKSWSRGTVIDTATARQIRRIIIGHAHRYVFDKEQSDVPLILPRKVDLDAYRKEQATWQNWHYEQSAAEADFPR